MKKFVSTLLTKRTTTTLQRGTFCTTIEKGYEEFWDSGFDIVVSTLGDGIYLTTLL